MSPWIRKSTVAGEDYKTTIWAYYRYYPSEAAAILFTVLFDMATFVHLYQLVRHRTWSFIPFLIGGFFEWVGYIGRILSSTESPDCWTMGSYIQQTLLLSRAPALFAASIYMMLGRIVVLLDAEQLCLFKKKWLSKFFVCGDILSFTVQAAGGGVMAGGGLSAVHNGENIVIAGPVIQIVFFGVFIATCALFHKRIKKSPTEQSLGLNGTWCKHLHILYAANLLIMIRSVFRLIEYAMGNNGYLLRHEVFLYVFDGLLMLLVMILLNAIHPSGLISTRRKERR
ncbi:RTA1 domain-containing protein [Aspergillus foveolatus]|uniref:RTA1 domain-containing protein n=1 Tax=Aspergillus foveolatus TaxID=210207 RepID=UPI003CCDA330